MKGALKWVLLYLLGVAINLVLINKYYKINFAYDSGGKSFITALSIISYGATPAVIFVCWDSNRKWCNK